MLKDQNGQRACPDMSRADVIRELVDYFVSARNTLGTGVKFGVIESLGMWRISTGYGTYLPTADLTEVLDLSTFLDELQSEAASRNLSPPLTIDHFDEDFGFEGALYDGGYAYLDYGRILGAENVIKSRGMKAGVFVSALHDPNSSNYNASARDRTIQFMQGYFKTT